MAEFPTSASVVIIGQGGIVGASVAHHLIERGWENIVGLDTSSIPTDVGSTAHASDFCYATAHDHMTCHTTMYSIDFYENFSIRIIRSCFLFSGSILYYSRIYGLGLTCKEPQH